MLPPKGGERDALVQRDGGWVSPAFLFNYHKIYKLTYIINIMGLMEEQEMLLGEELYRLGFENIEDILERLSRIELNEMMKQCFQ